MIRLSFIVPFYNVEKYIEECIRSLYNQDIPHDEYEVICVDDCSPDGSRAVIERLQKEYPTLHLLTTPENLRQGGARNMGLSEARGRYIWYIDSDDHISPNCLKSILNCAEQERLDMVRIYSNNDQKSDMIYYGPCTGSELVFDAPMRVRPEQRCSSVCMGPILRNLLLENNIWFTPKVQYEDDDYAYMFYALAHRVHLLPLDVYQIRYRENSTTHSAYTFQTIDYLVQQARRLIAREKILRKIDSRWTELTQRSVGWTCSWQILAHLSELPDAEQKKFYSKRMGWIKGVKKFVNWRVWFAMRSYLFYKKYYLRYV